MKGPVLNHPNRLAGCTCWCSHGWLCPCCAILTKTKQEKAELPGIIWLLQPLCCPFDGNRGARDGRRRFTQRGRTGKKGLLSLDGAPPLALLKNIDHISGGNLPSYHEMSSSRSSCIFYGVPFKTTSQRVKFEAAKVSFSFSCFVLSFLFSLFFVLYSYLFYRG